MIFMILCYIRGNFLILDYNFSTSIHTIPFRKSSNSWFTSFIQFNSRSISSFNNCTIKLPESINKSRDIGWPQYFIFASKFEFVRLNASIVVSLNEGDNESLLKCVIDVSHTFSAICLACSIDRINCITSGSYNCLSLYWRWDTNLPSRKPVENLENLSYW